MKIQYRYLLLGVWMLLIFGLSNEPADLSSARSGAIVQAINRLNPGLSEDLLTFLTRKAAHILLYFVLGLLALNVLCKYRLSATKMVLISILICFAYAVSDEFHQQFVPGRSAELRDILIDTVASSAGVGAYYLVSSYRANSKKHL